MQEALWQQQQQVACPAALLLPLQLLFPPVPAALGLQGHPQQHPQQQQHLHQLQVLLPGPLRQCPPAMALMQSRQTLEGLARCSWACLCLHTAHEQAAGAAH
jgi:hypothetical protein